MLPNELLAVLIFSLGMLSLSPAACADDNAPTLATDNPRELGLVNWSRELDPALEKAKATGKPVMLLFQEIPGCQGCVDFGKGPLSHPLLIEAIEEEFIPVAIHNNKPGYDAAILKRYNEPSWNYPVMRFLNADGQDIMPRKDRLYATNVVAERMINVLEQADRQVPKYLQLAAAESDTNSHESATFAMFCFWEGEANLGQLDGVISTKAGFLDGREVVDVVFDPNVITYEKLLSHAQKMECASRVYARNAKQYDVAKKQVGNAAEKSATASRAAPDSDQKHTLRRTEYRWLPLTPAQATKVNAALRLRQDPSPWLSPRQQALLDRIRTALKHDSAALDDLQRPASIADLAGYEGKLRERLRTTLAVKR